MSRIAIMAQSPATASERTDPAELIVAIACGLSLVSSALFLGVIPLIRSLAGSRDYVVYWATGHQLLRHGNPFDPAAMGALEHLAGFTGTGSYYMRNPPWSLPLTLPLGFFGARVAALPWSLLMLGLLILAAHTLYKLLGRPASHVQWLGYAFPAALQCVVMGQTSLFLLIGGVWFLRWHRTRPFRAGAALWLCTLKPHLLLPWAVVLLLWIFFSRSYRILLGAFSALAASIVATTIVDPRAWSEYLYWARHSGISHEFIPCLAIEFRNLINPHHEWLAFLPALLACAWAVAYFWPRRHSWDWMRDGNAVILVSLLVAPYCWFYDQCLAMPAIMAAAAATGSRRVLAALGILYLLIVIQPYAFHIGLDSHWYLWPSVAWLVWYIFARRSARASTPAAAPPVEAAHAV